MEFYEEDTNVEKLDYNLFPSMGSASAIEALDCEVFDLSDVKPRAEWASGGVDLKWHRSFGQGVAQRP